MLTAHRTLSHFDWFLDLNESTLFVRSEKMQGMSMPGPERYYLLFVRSVTLNCLSISGHEIIYDIMIYDKQLCAFQENSLS